MNTQIKLKALEAENARLKKQLNDIRSLIDAQEIKERINNEPPRILSGCEDKAARLELIDGTFYQDDDQDSGASDRSDIN